MDVVYARHAKQGRRTSATRARFWPHEFQEYLYTFSAKLGLGARLSVQVSFDAAVLREDPEPMQPAGRRHGNDSYWLCKHLGGDPIPGGARHAVPRHAVLRHAVPRRHLHGFPERTPRSPPAAPLRHCAIHMSQRLCLVITHTPCVAAYTTNGLRLDDALIP
jgi:hypothetical protein